MLKLLWPFIVLFLFEGALAEEAVKREVRDSESRFMTFFHDREFVYKRVGEQELKCFVYDPEGHAVDAKAPVIVLFFGGAWNHGTADQASAFCDYFSKHGLVSIAADYRVRKRGAKSPKDCVKDAKSMIRWIKENHEALGVDPERVIAGGFSAGGHIAAAAGAGVEIDEVSDDLSVSARPAALVLFNPVYDNSKKGYGHNVVKNYWEMISPKHNLDKKTPPTVVFLGDKDKFISVELAEDYQKVMKGLGVRSDLHIYKGRGHGFMNLPSSGKGNKHFDLTVRESVKFLESLELISPLE